MDTTALKADDETYVWRRPAPDVGRPLSNPPADAKFPYGHGFHSVASRAAPLFQATVRVRDLLLSPERPLQDDCKALRLLSNQFAAIYTAQPGDWFSTSQIFGHPSQLLAQRIAQEFRILESAATSNDAVLAQSAGDFLRDEAVVEMLDNAIEIAKGNTSGPETGWAYIAWSPDTMVFYGIGAKDGRIEDILAEVSEDHRRKPRQLGLLAAWHVHDPEMADAELKGMLARHATTNGYYHKISLKRVRDSIDKMLVETDNLVVSPWHADEERAGERLFPRLVRSPENAMNAGFAP